VESRGQERLYSIHDEIPSTAIFLKRTVWPQYDKARVSAVEAAKCESDIAILIGGDCRNIESSNFGDAKVTFLDDNGVWAPI